MTLEEAVILPLSDSDAKLVHRVLCATPHIYYSQDGGTYVLSEHDAASVRALRYLTSLEASALVLSPPQASLLRGAIARLYSQEVSIDELDWFYVESFTPAHQELEALMSWLDHKGFSKRAIYSLRPHH